MTRLSRLQTRGTFAGASLLGVALLFGCTSFIQAEGDGGPLGDTTPTAETSGTGGISSTSSAGTSAGTSADPSSAETTQSGESTLDPSTGDSAESSSGTVPPMCGDGMLDDGEACDDANQDDEDGCTSNCELTSCRDGRHNGSETDVDCGGDCLAQCETGAGCQDGGDCMDGVCDDDDGVCAAPTCDDGVHNGLEITADCGPVCRTPPVNVILNGGFGSGTDDWIVENPEINPQDAYFGDGQSNPVVELDQSGNNTSRWEQSFVVPEYQVGVTLQLRLRVGDRQSAGGDVGGLLIGIAGPDSNSLVLTGVSGPDFDNNNSTQLGVDATSVGSFQNVVVEFEPTAPGSHILELLEQTSGGDNLNNGGGIVMDDVEVRLVTCGG